MLARAILLLIDRGPFPTYPHGRINYLFLGFVAAVLGALSPAALLTADYTAGVFLGIGIGQFHTVRQMDRSMLLSLEDAELVPRGKAYVEGLALMVETRNYLAMLAAVVGSALTLIFGAFVGAVAGVAVACLTTWFARLGRTVGAVCDVGEAPVAHDGSAISVGGTPVWWEPPAEALAALPRAIGLVVRPRHLAARLTLAQPGQRQAVLHDLASHLGVAWADPAHPGARGEGGARGGSDRPRYLMPQHAVDEERGGRVAVLLFPAARQSRAAVQVVRSTPLLETLTHRWLSGDLDAQATAPGRRDR